MPKRPSFTERELKIIHQIFEEKQAAWQKRLVHLPLLGPLLAGFGLVSTFYGFEKILDRTFLVDQPWLLLFLGILALLLTGAYYKKLL